MPEQKILSISNLKFDDTEQGKFTGVFSTLNIIDKDDDITISGAFGTQNVILSQYNHGSWGQGAGALPIGVGVISEKGNEGIIEGEIDMDDPAAVAVYKKMKYLKSKGRVQEFSYSLPEIDYEYQERDGKRVRVLKRIKVNEVSPVLMGAGVNTRLLDIKSHEEKKAIPSHTTGTNDSAWSAGKNEKKVKQDQKLAYYKKIYGWYDPDGEVGVKSTYKFIHHFVSEDGTPGDASTRACSSGIAILNGARGGTNIPDADRKGLYNHLAKHLRDADKEPPELRSVDAQGTKMPLTDHIEVLIADAEEVIERLEEVKGLRGEEGRNPSEATLKRADMMKSQLSELISRLDKVEEKQSDVLSEFVKFQEITAKRRYVNATIN